VPGDRRRAVGSAVSAGKNPGEGGWYVTAPAAGLVPGDYQVGGWGRAGGSYSETGGREEARSGGLRECRTAMVGSGGLASGRDDRSWSCTRLVVSIGCFMAPLRPWLYGGCGLDGRAVIFLRFSFCQRNVGSSLEAGVGGRGGEREEREGEGARVG